MEEAGFSTVVLNPTWEFTRAEGIPRTAAIEHPYARPVGQIGDREGQRKVLLEALSVFEKAKKPGEVFHLPFTWPEDPRKTDWQPPEMSPLIKHYLEDIKKARKAQEEKGA
ncbi:MAG: hypothetical protein KGZ49_02000 [Syntrophaceae bacterium]|nr:hypothetical protein [Syntrophaceae bacterium]